MSLWPQSSIPTPLTPQQQLQAQVAADVQLLASVLASLLSAVETVAGHCYQNSINNGTPNETFGPQDYLNALATVPNAPTAVQLLEISAATLGSGTTPGYLPTLATIQPPPAPLVLPTLPLPGVTLTPNQDGATVAVAGQTPLQIAQAAVIAALAAQTTAQQSQAADVTALQATVATTLAARTAAYASRTSPTDPNWIGADAAWQAATAALTAAQQTTAPLAEAVTAADAAVVTAQAEVAAAQG